MRKLLMLPERLDPKVLRAMARIATDPLLQPFLEWIDQIECEQLEKLRDTDEQRTDYFRGTARLAHDLAVLIHDAPERVRAQVSPETATPARDHAGDREVGPAIPARPMV
ncbi:MAG TPA: hypothetical protein PLG73_09040 [Candidatus Sumerlaeota bacterium]|nr:hypothetical protein [Candidatus Sumerlaeota bacterium]